MFHPKLVHLLAGKLTKVFVCLLTCLYPLQSMAETIPDLLAGVYGMLVAGDIASVVGTKGTQHA